MKNIRREISREMKKEEKIFRKEWKNIIFNCIFAVIVVLIPSLLYKNIALTTVLLILVSAIALFKWKSKAAIVIFIFGALWGPISEMIAIHFGAWSYTLVNFYTIPIWLFFIWGDAAVFLFEMSKEVIKLGFKDNLK